MIQRQALRQERGFSLFEVLIALLVLSIGLLGASSMQLSALNINQGAYSRFQAVNIANELSERIHANVAAADSEVYANIDFTWFDCSDREYNDVDIVYCSDHQGTGATECTVSEMAIFDTYEAYCGSKDLLLSREISIACQDSDTGDAFACTPGSIHTIRVAWAKDGGNTLVDSRCPTGKACISLELLP